MPLLKKLTTMAAKVESTIGTAESLTASEGVFNIYDPEVSAEIEVEGREANGSFDNLSGVSGSQAGTLTFKTDAGWSGTGTPEWADTLLPACGYVESSQVFRPTSEAPGSNVKTVTIGFYEWAGSGDALFKVLAGAVGNFKIMADAGKVVMIEWEFKGVWQAPTDVTMIEPTYPTHKAVPVCKLDDHLQLDCTMRCSDGVRCRERDHLARVPRHGSRLQERIDCRSQAGYHNRPRSTVGHGRGSLPRLDRRRRVRLLVFLPRCGRRIACFGSTGSTDHFDWPCRTRRSAS